MTNLQCAKEQLTRGGYTCVLAYGTRVQASTARGVKPLVAWCQSGVDYNGFSAADKVVGRATAFLYALLGVRAVYAGVISRSALEVLHAHAIEVEYGTCVDYIVNRTGDGMCPFEQAVLSICDKQEAYQAILEQMKKLNI